MTHTRACPKCRKIIPWTFGEPEGKHKTKPAKLICPEHGEFEPRAHEQLEKKLDTLNIVVGNLLSGVDNLSERVTKLEKVSE